MLHWANAFGLMALISAVFALSGLSLAVSGMAQILFWLNAGLFALALLTGLFGRGRDGLYSAERALWWVAVAGVGLMVGVGWVS